MINPLLLQLATLSTQHPLSKPTFTTLPKNLLPHLTTSLPKFPTTQNPLPLNPKPIQTLPLKPSTLNLTTPRILSVNPNPPTPTSTKDLSLTQLLHLNNMIQSQNTMLLSTVKSVLQQYQNIQNTKNTLQTQTIPLKPLLMPKIVETDPMISPKKETPLFPTHSKTLFSPQEDSVSTVNTKRPCPSTDDSDLSAELQEQPRKKVKRKTEEYDIEKDDDFEECIKTYRKRDQNVMENLRNKQMEEEKSNLPEGYMMILNDSIKVGPNHQADLTVLKDRKRKAPVRIWNPSLIDEAGFKEYFDKLEGVLAYTNINHDRALKILKRAEMDIDKAVNIVETNKSYYRMYLVVEYKKYRKELKKLN